tara:strand:+ start:870 stop:1241 length:372 start_codon:yes stop_codon:yes gene_type:complete
MANIELKRGQKAQVDITFKNSAGTVVNFSSGFTASLTLRKDAANGSISGEEIDSLTTANSRITLVYSSSGPNIQLKWSTVQASALPNEALTLIGDLKITDTQPNPDEVIHSFRLTFDIIPEII